MGMHAYTVDWLVTPDDDSLPERRGSCRVAASSNKQASNGVIDEVGLDSTCETLTVRAWPGWGGRKLPPLESPR